MGPMERAERLERDSGKRLDDYPYSDEDYARMKSLRGLDMLRGVRESALRKMCWGLYWICEGVKAPRDMQGDEWRMSDEDFDTSSPRIPPETNGILRAEWSGFNKRMDVWAAKRYRETGVMVSDSEKREHTSRFAAICRKLYGASYPTNSTENDH